MKQIDLDLLRAIWHPLSYVEDENCAQSLKVWLSEGNFYLNNAAPNLSLFCLDTNELKKCLSLDAFRFSSHAAQTVYEMEKTSAYEKLTSWRVIQTYYAAFYAAHAALRFFGQSFSHLENGHINFLRGRCQSEAGYTPSLQSSYYLIEIEPNTRNVSFARHGESHKDLWKCFLALITNLEKEVLSLRASQERREDLSAHFLDLKVALTNRGQFSAGNWLSAVRNQVNYKSLEGVWFPFSKSTPSFESLLGKVRDWRSGAVNLGRPSLEKNELERFFTTALSVVDFGISLSLDYQSLVVRRGRRSSGFSRLVNSSVAA
ncbi:hypothetical protein [Leisingera sp. M523]|uniref:hypothetical protein n=1 Tax=Leisingera sp. M523 TaxID=2867013 RepID=UPI0021A264E6|nr:hypothetical protein [Leisingera sp. M523]UWQ27279.1 hypothetical protein K3557_10580 [Leisingera sp. M523]